MSRKSAPKGQSASSANGTSPEPTRHVHLVLQGKGGVGKTYVASLLGQYYAETGRPVVCYDADTVNASLSAVTALAALPVKLFDGDHIAVDEVDQLIEDLLNASTDAIVDNGASGFVPFSRYLIDAGIAEIFSDRGVQLTIHVVVAGGGMVADTLSGLLSIFESYPPTVRVVVWINEFFGRVVANGLEFEQMPIYRDHRDRIVGIVHLEQLSQASIGNVLNMLDRKLTFSEAISNPAFSIVPKQRLTMVRREIFKQLEPLV